MGSMVRSWQDKPDGVGLNQVGLVDQVLEGLKDAPAWSKAALRSWQHWSTALQINSLHRFEACCKRLRQKALEPAPAGYPGCVRCAT